MPKPYVYLCIHKTTGEFYWGSRWKNEVPAKQDLGTHYFTSSNVVSKRFHEFYWIICGEFETPEHTYDVEQKLIKATWGNPLMLNGTYRMRGEKHKWGPADAERRAKISATLRGQKLTPEAIAKRTATRKARGIKASTKAAIAARIGSKHTPETIAKIRAKRKLQIITPEQMKKAQETKRQRKLIKEGLKAAHDA